MCPIFEIMQRFYKGFWHCLEGKGRELSLPWNLSQVHISHSAENENLFYSFSFSQRQNNNLMGIPKDAFIFKLYSFTWNQICNSNKHAQRNLYISIFPSFNANPWIFPHTHNSILNIHLKFIRFV